MTIRVVAARREGASIPATSESERVNRALSPEPMVNILDAFAAKTGNPL